MNVIGEETAQPHRVTRRAALRTMVAATTGTTAAIAGWRLAVGNEGDAEWDYGDEHGPEAWGESFETCGTGAQQSPIDLAGASPVEIDDVHLDFGTVTAFMLENNGHSVDVRDLEVNGGRTAVIEGTEYQVLEFHFHAPSEHTIDGVPQDMEIHIKMTDGNRLAVLGILLTAGDPSEALDPIFGSMPEVPSKGTEYVVGDVAIDLNQLLPVERTTYRYAGSLTTPPCTEGVSWIVFAEPVQVSQDQIDLFRSVITFDNARPTQDVQDHDPVIDDDAS